MLRLIPYQRIPFLRCCVPRRLLRRLETIKFPSSPEMEETFSKRFNIHIDLDKARQRFVSKVFNHIFSCFPLFVGSNRDEVDHLEREIWSALGHKFDYRVKLSSQVGPGFEQNLQALEVLMKSRYLGARTKTLVNSFLTDSEVDLEVRLHEGKFFPAGAPLLDEKLVNDVLAVLSQDNHETVLQPFNKGLEHLLKSTNNPELLLDVITDMYEALEAMVKIVLGNTKDLSANWESFISKLNLSEYFKKLSKDYIEYANVLARHAANPGEGKLIPEYKEVESFVYMTGLFIRLAAK